MCRPPTRSRAVPATTATCISTSAATTATPSRRMSFPAPSVRASASRSSVPEGQFVLGTEPGRPLVFAACDLGFAPVKSLVEYALSADAATSYTVAWLATRADGHYLANQCRAWAEALGRLRLAAARPCGCRGRRRAARGVAARHRRSIPGRGLRRRARGVRAGCRLRVPQRGRARRCHRDAHALTPIMTAPASSPAAPFPSPPQATTSTAPAAARNPSALLVLGDSMAPEFAEGDVIVIEPEGLATTGPTCSPATRTSGSSANWSPPATAGSCAP